MSLPKLSTKNNKRTQLKVFGGIDQRDKISDFSFTDTTNMSSDAYPALSPRKGRSKITVVPNASAICNPEYGDSSLTSFTGVAGERFFYKGTQIGGYLTKGEKSIADFNGKICIFPDKKYYDYIPDSETGEISSSLKSMERTAILNNAVFYSSYDEISGEYTSYISGGGSFNLAFSPGDSIVIENCAEEHNNVKPVESRKQAVSSDAIVCAVVNKVSSNKLDLLLYNKSGAYALFKNTTESGYITVKTVVPDMNHICVHNNRLWGTAASGEYIYASKLGDCTNFNSFRGLGDDSWYSYIATGGSFTGICSYRTAVVAFKREYIHHIYGESPTNFSIPKQIFGGCIDGKSICETGGILYYLAYNGFRAYSGGEPYDISPQLKTKYLSCAAGTDGKHYYASAKRNDGKYDVLVYDTKSNIWTREDDTAFIDFCNYNGSIYGITNGEMYRLDGGTETFKWCFVSKRFTYDEADFKSVLSLCLRMDLMDNTLVEVLFSADGKDFIPCGTVRGGQGFTVYQIPVRFKKCNSFRIMLSGIGDAVIHDIEITSYNGGRFYGNY